jgi:4'-phosphopantetheinyl transferase
MTLSRPSPPWAKHGPQPGVADAELHVWQAKLDTAEEERSELALLLSADEHERAARFRFDRDRCRFVSGRGILRSILGCYLGCAPNRLVFSYGLRGKPTLPGTTLQFNLTHSDGLALLAVTRGGAVGIDIECIRPVPDYDHIMRSFFSTIEVEAILALPAADQLQAFFTCWTRKEAYVKATGDGITVPLDRFSVASTPGSPPRLLHVEGAPQEVTRWSFDDIPLEPCYLGVVALEGKIRAVQHCLWSKQVS